MVANPFLKGFAYTSGVAMAIILTSVIATLINELWSDFQWFSILNPNGTSTE